MAEAWKPRLLPLLLIASLLTLVVTVVRVVGEREGWSPAWFDRTAYSPWNPFGIVWLVPVFGFLFGRRLAMQGSRAPFVAAFFVPMFALLLLVGVGGYMRKELTDDALRTGFGWLFWGGPVLALLALFAWPRAFLVNLLYGMLARLPVVVVQVLDVQNGWQTHYGKVHGKLPSMTADERLWLLTMAQVTVWIPFTVLLGSGFAALGAATVRR